ncbi:MAG: AbrB family transcriptional regulator, partial [Angustibacter sp.]
AQVRQALGLVEGDELQLTSSAGGFLLRTRAAALAELRALGESIPANRSLVDELIAERRTAALAE